MPAGLHHVIEESTSSTISLHSPPEAWYVDVALKPSVTYWQLHVIRFPPESAYVQHQQLFTMAHSKCVRSLSTLFPFAVAPRACDRRTSSVASSSGAQPRFAASSQRVERLHILDHQAFIAHTRKYFSSSKITVIAGADARAVYRSVRRAPVRNQIALRILRGRAVLHDEAIFKQMRSFSSRILLRSSDGFSMTGLPLLHRERQKPCKPRPSLQHIFRYFCAKRIYHCQKRRACAMYRLQARIL